MSKLTASDRNSLPANDFALPTQRKYPVPDKNHARVAKSYASKEARLGILTPAQKAQVDRKANTVLKK